MLGVYNHKKGFSPVLLVFFLISSIVSCSIDPISYQDAIKVGDIELVQKSSKRIDINKAINGEYPLVTAARFNQLEVFKFFVDLGADVNTDFEPGYPLAFWLTEKGKEQEVRYLIDNGFDINTKRKETGSTLMHIAVFSMSQEFMSYLIEKGFNLDLQNNRSQTSLSLAILHSQIESAIFLINSGANVNFSIYNISSIWVYIAKYVDDRDIELANLSYAKGGIIVNEGLQNGLFAAVEHGKTSFLRWLLEHGADPLVEDSRGNIPIDYIYLITSSPEGPTTQKQKDVFDEVYSTLIEYGSRKPR